MKRGLFPTRRLLLLSCAPALLAPLSLWWQTATAAFFALVGALLVIATWDALRLRAAPRAQVQRRLPERARKDQPFDVVYQLKLPDGRARPARVELIDEWPVDLGGDLRVGPCWLTDDHPVDQRAALVPTRRGRRPCGAMHLFQLSPLGLFTQRTRVSPGQALSVLPTAAPVAGHGLGNRNAQEDLGIRPQRQRGEGSEFESLREYTPDDEPRSIDWRASARSRNLVVRQLQIERNHTVLIAVDCGRLMAGRGGDSEHTRKLDRALDAAIHLSQACARNGDRVGFVGFHQELCAWVPPQPPRRALGPILEATLSLEPQAVDGSYRNLTAALQQRQRKRTLLVIMTDFVEGASAVELERYLLPLSRRHTVLLVGVRDPTLSELDHPEPELDEERLFRRIVLQDLDNARELALRRITRLGVHTLDLDPQSITAPVLDRYLRLREAGLA